MSTGSTGSILHTFQQIPHKTLLVHEGIRPVHELWPPYDHGVRSPFQRGLYLLRDAFLSTALFRHQHINREMIVDCTVQCFTERPLESNDVRLIDVQGFATLQILNGGHKPDDPRCANPSASNTTLA